MPFRRTTHLGICLVLLVAVVSCKDSFDEARCDRPCAEIDAAGSSGAVGGSGATAGNAGASGAGPSGHAGTAAMGGGGSGGAAAGAGGAGAGFGGSGGKAAAASGGGGSGGVAGTGGVAGKNAGGAGAGGGGAGGVGGATCNAAACPLGCTGGACAAPVQLALGRAHTCFRLDNGSVRCWGANDAGQLGSGVTSSPVLKATLVQGLSDAAFVTSGQDHVCVKRMNGAVVCWGKNDLGQVGMTGATYAAPTVISGLTVSAVAAGARHTCATRTSGTVACWGDDLGGQTGGGSMTMPTPPATAVGGVSNPLMIAAGDSRSCALAAGALLCWGSDGFGMGSGTIGANAAVIGGVSGASLLAVGGFHVCAETTGSVVQCLGRNDEGQLGIGTSGGATSTTSPSLVNGLSGVKQLAAGGRHTCALHEGGSVACWGDATHGQIGEGTIGAGMTVTAPSSLSTATLVSISTGDAHTCAITGKGAVLCWGANDRGQLGDGTMSDQASPVAVVF